MLGWERMVNWKTNVRVLLKMLLKEKSPTSSTKTKQPFVVSTYFKSITMNTINKQVSTTSNIIF